MRIVLLFSDNFSFAYSNFESIFGITMHHETANMVGSTQQNI